MSMADLSSVAGAVADAAVKAGGNNAQARVWCGAVVILGGLQRTQPLLREVR
jgi:hypothetical protein